MRVEIWTDIACPWCYVGSARFRQGLAAFAHRDQVEVVHRSFELNPQAENGDVPIIEAVAAQYGRTREQQVAREEQAAAMAEAMGLGYRAGGRVFGNTFDVHRLLHFARTRDAQARLMDIAFRINFAEERSIYDRETLVHAAVEAGLDAKEVRDVLDVPTPTPRRYGPTSAWPPNWVRTASRSSCWTGATESAASSRPRLSPGHWSRPGPTGRRSEHQGRNPLE